MTALRDDQSRCVGRSDLGPDSPVCPKREQCARYVDLRDRGSDYEWTRISVFTHVCGDPELSQFVPVEVVGHERNVALKPDIAQPLEGITLMGDGEASSMGENTVIGGAL